MKLNPFSKKSNAYFNKVKAKFEQLDAELQSALHELEEAKIDCEQKEHRHRELSERGSRFSSTAEEKKAALAASAARNRIGSIEGEIKQLRHRIAPSFRIVLAPEQFAKAKQTLDELLAKDKATTSEIDRINSVIEKVEKRIAATQTRIANETQAATRAMLDAADDFTVPDALAKAEAELRLGQATLADLQTKRQDVIAERSDLPKAIEAAKGSYISHRSVMAEIELYEQLVPVMEQLARASVARRESLYHHDESRFEIEIPADLIESAKASLAAEMPKN